MVIFLKAIGWLCLVGGALLAFIGVVVHQSADAIRNLIAIIAAALVGSIVWFALAVIIQRVERVESLLLVQRARAAADALRQGSNQIMPGGG
jgi:hypothetical protein